MTLPPSVRLPSVPTGPEDVLRWANQTQLAMSSIYARLAAESATKAPIASPVFTGFVTGMMADKGGQVYNVKAYGAYGDGSHDDTTAIQAAMTAVGTATGIVYFPTGTYKVTSTLSLLAKTGVYLQGAGRYASTITWAGPAASAVIEFVNCYQSGVSGLAIVGNPSAQPSAGIWCYSDHGQTLPATGIGKYTFRDLLIGGPASNEMVDGIVFSAADSASDTNNDLNLFDNVHVSNLSGSAFALRHSQCKGNLFVHCRVTTAAMAVDAGTSVQGSFGGGFNWIGGYVTATSSAAFYVKGGNDELKIEDVGFEGCYRILRTVGSSSSGWPVTIQSCRFDVTSMSSDNDVVVYNFGGPLRIINNVFDDVNVTGKVPLILWSEGAGVQHSLFIQGNAWNVKGASSVNVLDAASTAGITVFQYGNTYFNTAGTNSDVNANDMVNATNSVNVATTATTANTKYSLTGVPSSSSGNQATGVFAAVSYNPSSNYLSGTGELYLWSKGVLGLFYGAGTSSAGMAIYDDSNGHIDAVNGSSPALIFSSWSNIQFNGWVVYASGGTDATTNLNLTGSLAVIQGAKTLSNGLNSNIATPTSSWVRITGPTAAFAIGGLTLGRDGYRLTLYNTTAYAMTITNEDTSSTAANRIKTLTGANVVLRTGASAATLIYDATDGRWILTGTN